MLKTNNYNLCQWDAADPIRREDFNADNAAIDAVLGELGAAAPKIIMGAYTGTGTTEATHYSIGARPKQLILWTDNTVSGNTYNCFFFAVDGAAFTFNSAGGQSLMTDFVSFDEDGFTLNHAKFKTPGLGFNPADKTQTYWVLC